MEYAPNFYLNAYISKVKWGVVLGTLFMTGFCFVGSIGFYAFTDNHIMRVFNVLFVVYICFVTIYATFRDEVRKINQIVNKVIVDDVTVHFITYSYRFLFYKRDAGTFTVNKKDIVFEEMKFPYKTSNLPKTKTWCITVDEQKILFLYEYYPAELKSQLD